MLATLSAEDCRASARSTSSKRASSARPRRPFFIDKMPNNFAHIGLIHLALPNAKIIDARRHPLGCCFSGFKQHFARGQDFTYGLEDIGRYYRDYVELMAHFDAVLPGRIHRVIYESMIDDTEAEVRRLLEYCGLPFEEAACASTRTNAPCAPPAPSRCASRSFARRRAVAPLRAVARAPEKRLGAVLEHTPPHRILRISAEWHSLRPEGRRIPRG